VSSFWGTITLQITNIMRVQFLGSRSAVKEELTLQELAEKYQVHPNQISVWKRKLLEQSSTLFERKNKKDEEYNELKKEKEELFRQLGQMQYENEWLKDDMISSVHREWYARV